MGFSRPEMRTAPRLDVAGRPLDWNVRPARRLIGHGSVHDEALVLDVTPRGARVLAPRSDVAGGDWVVIGHRRDRGRVQVRWISPSDDPTRCVYGVVFVALDPGLATYLLSI